MSIIKEKTKTVLLISLVALSIIFTISIWFGEKLWSLDYSFFSDFSVFSTNHKSKTDQDYAKSVLGLPKSILVSSNGLKNELSQRNNGFLALWKSTKNSLKIFLSSTGKRAITIDENRFKTVLQGDCIYVDFGTNYSTDFLAQNYNCDNQTESLVFNSIIIKPPDPESDQYSFLLKDEISNKMYEFYLSDANLNLLPAGFLPSDAAAQNKSFSFEINFDKKSSDSDSLSQKALIDSMVLLNLNTDTKAEITPVNPIVTASGDLDENIINKIAVLFNVNPQTTRKFTDEDQSVTFVENYSVLKIHADGYIEYHTTDESAAPAISNNPGGNYGTIYATSKFIDNVIDATDSQNQLMLSSDLTAPPTDGTASMTYDYKINATPIALSINASSHDAIKHAVEIQIKNNKIVSYQHYLRHYITTENKIALDSSITALDRLVADYSTKSTTTVTDMYPIYLDDANTATLHARWYIRTKSDKEIVLN